MRCYEVVVTHLVALKPRSFGFTNDEGAIILSASNYKLSNIMQSNSSFYDFLKSLQKICYIYSEDCNSMKQKRLVFSLSHKKLACVRNRPFMKAISKCRRKIKTFQLFISTMPLSSYIYEYDANLNRI